MSADLSQRSRSISSQAHWEFSSYSYLDGFEMFEDPSSNCGDAWQISLSCKINNTYSDYEQAISAYNDSGCEILRDYHDLSLKIQVLLLANLFWKIRKYLPKCLQAWSLSPFFHSEIELGVYAHFYKG